MRGGADVNAADDAMQVRDDRRGLTTSTKSLTADRISDLRLVLLVPSIQTPLHLAASQGWWEVVDVLVKQAGVAVDLRGQRQETALLLACEEGHGDVSSHRPA